MKNRYIKKTFRGYVECSCSDSSWERFMNVCRHHGIDLWKIHSGKENENKRKFCIYAGDYQRLLPISRKTGIVPRIERKKGIPFRVQKIKIEWTFYSGFLFFVVVLAFLSQFVWEIHFTGQKSYSVETLQKTVEKMNVYRGMQRKNLDCDTIEKEIRKEHPDISWVSAEEKGSFLQISVKEGKKDTAKKTEETFYHVTAKEDGIIESIVVNRGIAMVKKGDAVKAGQILISGILPITNDSDESVGKVYVSADGIVKMKVTKEYNSRISCEGNRKVYTGNKIYVYSFDIGKYDFSLKKIWKRLDNSKRYDIITSVCADKIFRPIGCRISVRETCYLEYEWKKHTLTTEEFRQEGVRRYKRWQYLLQENEAELIAHEAVMKKQKNGDFILQAVITYCTNKTELKPVSKQEMEENNDGQSGNDS